MNHPLNQSPVDQPSFINHPLTNRPMTKRPYTDRIGAHCTALHIGLALGCEQQKKFCQLVLYKYPLIGGVE